MRLQARDIVAIEQPVQLLGGEGDDLVTGLTWPVKTRFFQPLLPQAKPIRFPIEHLDIVASSVAKHVELLRERVQAQSVLDQHSQTINTATEVDRVPAQVDRRDVIGGPHHDTLAAVDRTRDKVAASTVPPKETARPLGSWTCHWFSLAGRPPMISTF